MRKTDISTERRMICIRLDQAIVGRNRSVKLVKTRSRDMAVKNFSALPNV
jgi:hypothetical protein